MKHTILPMLVGMLWVSTMAYAQKPVAESTPIDKVPAGITYQLGQGANNTLKWAYPYGTKLTVNGGVSRNFELTSIQKNGEGFALRQFSQGGKKWSAWKRIITDNGGGRVGIGTAAPRHTLDVNGTIRGREVRVEASPWPDFVFEPTYDLMSLPETEQYIHAHGHLPAIPSAQAVAADGVALGEMNAKLLQKIEEMTLHMIEMNKELQRVKSELETLKDQ